MILIYEVVTAQIIFIINKKWETSRQQESLRLGLAEDV